MYTVVSPSATRYCRIAPNTSSRIQGLKDSAPEVRARVENVLRDAVSNWPREQLVRELAVGQIRADVIGAQKAVIDQNAQDLAARDKEIAELKMRVAEQDEFIKAQAASFPRGELGGTTTNGNGNGGGSLLQNVRIRIPGQ